jgi:hypothetical protein
MRYRYALLPARSIRNAEVESITRCRDAEPGDRRADAHQKLTVVRIDKGHSPRIIGVDLDATTGRAERQFLRPPTGRREEREPQQIVELLLARLEP